MNFSRAALKFRIEISHKQLAHIAANFIEYAQAIVTCVGMEWKYGIFVADL